MTRSPAVRAAAFIAAVFFFAVSYGPLNLYDEGIILVGAQRVANGEIPYKDFWSMYPPGNYYIEALLFSLFGEQVYLNRIFDALTKVAIIGMCYRIFRIYLSRPAALVLAAAATVFLLLVKFPGFPVYQATLLALVVTAILIHAERRRQRDCDRRGQYWLPFLAGATTGAITYFRHDLAAYTLIAAIALFAVPLVTGEGRHVGARSATRFAAYAGGIAVTFLPLAIGLLAYAGYHDVYFSLFASPAEIYPSYRSLPFPRFADLDSQAVLTYLPFTVLLCSLPLITLSLIRARAGNPSLPGDAGTSNPVLVFLIAMVALFSLKGLVRPNAVHLAPAIIMSMVLVAYLVGRFPSRIATTLVIILVAFFFAAPGLKVTRKYLANIPKVASSCRHPQHPSLVCVPADEDTVKAATFITEQLPQVTTAYVGTGIHDRIYVGNTAAYFLIGKRPASKWHELHPGIQTRADIQAEIIAELTNADTVVVALDRRWDTTREPNLSGESSHQHALDEFLRDCWAPVKQFGDLTLYTKDARCFQ